MITVQKFQNIISNLTFIYEPDAQVEASPLMNVSHYIEVDAYAYPKGFIVFGLTDTGTVEVHALAGNGDTRQVTMTDDHLPVCDLITFLGGYESDAYDDTQFLSDL